MFERLNVIAKYNSIIDLNNFTDTINKLYSMTCEMKSINEEELDVYKKANELDKFYEEKKGRKPKHNNMVLVFIEKEYKLFNPTDWNKFLINPRFYDTKRVASELAKEGCELISEYKNGQTPIYYIYKGKRYYVKFENWRRSHYRPHLGQFPGAHDWDEYNAAMGYNIK